MILRAEDVRDMIRDLEHRATMPDDERQADEDWELTEHLRMPWPTTETQVN